MKSPLATILALLLASAALQCMPNQAHAGEETSAGSEPAALDLVSVLSHNRYCRRSRVVWSGGVPRQGPDLIAPRSIRSKWPISGHNRIRCTDPSPFKRTPLKSYPGQR